MSELVNLLIVGDLTVSFTGQLYSMQVDLESGKGFLGLKVHLD